MWWIPGFVMITHGTKLAPLSNFKDNGRKHTRLLTRKVPLIAKPSKKNRNCMSKGYRGREKTKAKREWEYTASAQMQREQNCNTTSTYQFLSSIAWLFQFENIFLKFIIRIIKSLKHKSKINHAHRRRVEEEETTWSCSHKFRLAQPLRQSAKIKRFIQFQETRKHKRKSYLQKAQSNGA